MIDHFWRDASTVLSCQFFSTVLKCGAQLPIHTLNHVVSGARFLTAGMFECNIAYRRSVAVLCMLYTIRCNPMHPFDYLDSMCQCGLHALPWSHIGILIRRLFCCGTWSTAELLFPYQYLQWNDLADPVFDGVGLAGFKSRANAFLLA